MHNFLSLSLSLPSSSPLLNLSSHHFISKQQRILRIFSFLHSIFIGISLSLPSYQNAKLITTSHYKQPHHTLQLMFHNNETDHAIRIQKLCNQVGIKCFISYPPPNQPSPQLQPQPKRVVIDLEKLPDTLEDTIMQDHKTPPPSTPPKTNKKRQRSPSPPSPQSSSSPSPSPPPPPSPKSYNLRSRKVIFQNFDPPQPPAPPKHYSKPINFNSPNLRQLPPPPPSHCFGDPVYPYEYQLPDYPSHWRFRIFYDPRGFYYFLSYGHMQDLDRNNRARRVA